MAKDPEDLIRPRRFKLIKPIPLTEEERSELLSDVEMELIRPRTREDCSYLPRPCPFVGCKFHTYLDIDDKTGYIRLNWPGMDPHEIDEDKSCVLDMIEAYDYGSSMMPPDLIGLALGAHRDTIKDETRKVQTKLKSALLKREYENYEEFEDEVLENVGTITYD